MAESLFIIPFGKHRGSGIVMVVGLYVLLIIGKGFGF